MFSVRKAVNYTRNNGIWKVHSCSFLDVKGHTLQFTTVEAAEEYARDQMENCEYYNKPDTMGYIAYCTIYQGKEKIKEILR